MMGKNYDYDGVLVFVVVDGLKVAFKYPEVVSDHLFLLFAFLLKGRVNTVELCTSYLTAKLRLKKSLEIFSLTAFNELKLRLAEKSFPVQR